MWGTPDAVSLMPLLVFSCLTPVPSLRAEETETEFRGEIAKKHEDSVDWRAPKSRQPKGAPTVIIFLLDDTGLAQIGSFGGLINTPNIDRLAAGRLRYHNFHTTSLCYPSRATLMARRNPHTIGLGSHALTAMGFPGYNAIGQWGHTPLYEVSQIGPFNHWPSHEAFPHSYCFMAADVHQFVPVLWDDHHPEPYRRTEHLDKDLADRKNQWITGHKSLDKNLPFMMLWALGSMHSPPHAPDSYLDKHKGKFDQGWDKTREQKLRIGRIRESFRPTQS
jgi:arylsulfatase A-like enzyme